MGVRPGMMLFRDASLQLYCLLYADDMVLLAKEEGGMRLVLGETREYFREKDSDLNVDKTKVMRFGKRMRGMMEME